MTLHPIQRPVQTSGGNTKATDTSAGVLTYEFGLATLLTFAGPADANLASLALGSDLSTLGVDANSAQSLHPVFAGQWVEPTHGRLHDADFRLPCESVITQGIRETLGGVKLSRHEGLPRVVFGSFTGDVLLTFSAA